MSSKKSVKVTAEEALEGTEAGVIWKEIKDKKIEMFALPDQRVHQYCMPHFVDPSKLFLLSSATSVLPALEMALGKEYVVELMTKYIVVSRVK